MKKTPVTPAQIHAALLLDPQYMAQPDEFRTALKPFIDALPTTLASLLGKKVSLKTVMLAKAAYMKALLDGDLMKALYGEVKAAVEQVADDALPGLGGLAAGLFGDMDPAAMLKDMLESIIEESEDLAKNTAKILKENGVKERDVLAGTLGMDGAALERYDTGTLTIADLLILKPYVILRSR